MAMCLMLTRQVSQTLGNAFPVSTMGSWGVTLTVYITFSAFWVHSNITMTFMSS